MTDPITPARLRETLDRALADYIPGIDRAVHFVSIEQVDMLAEFYLHTRADLSDALLREAMKALENRDGGRHDDDCKAFRPINGMCNCGHDEAIATLAKLKECFPNGI